MADVSNMSEMAVDKSNEGLGPVNRYENEEDFYKSFEAGPVNSLLGSCTGGLERSNTFNSLMPLTGAIVPQIKPESKNDPDFPIRHAGKGVALAEMLEMVSDESSTVGTDGLHLKYFDKPVNHLVFITGEDKLPIVNRIYEILRDKLGAEGKSNLRVDLIMNYDVQEFQEATKKFVDSKKPKI